MPRALRRPPALFLLASALVASACSGAHGAGTRGTETPVPHADPANVAGDYLVRGDLFGGALEERIVFAARGPVYDVVRATTDGSVTASGVAIAEGDRLFVALGPRAASVDLVVLEAVGEGIRGTWAYGAKGDLGTETWVGSPASDDPFVGSFHTGGTDAETGAPYGGSVVVERQGESYTLRWTTGDVACRGRGLRVGSRLIVVGEGETGVPSAGARLPSGDALLGVYERRRTAYEGTTTILRSNGGYEAASETFERVVRR